MIESRFKRFAKLNNFGLICFVWLGLFIPENVFAQKHWQKDYVQFSRSAKKDKISISTGVYDYSFGPKSEHGFLANCTFEASFDNKKYFNLMEIQTPWQNMTNKTTVYFKNKLDEAKMIFSKRATTQTDDREWPEHLKSKITIEVPTTPKKLAAASIVWHLKKKLKKVRYIRISGKWEVPGKSAEHFSHVVYDLKYLDRNPLKSITPDAITNVSEKDSVNIIKDSEAIVIKGADIGANIKVYSNSGLLIKSVISNNDAVMIKLPVKQFYIVRVGKSRYKVVL